MNFKIGASVALCWFTLAVHAQSVVSVPKHNLGFTISPAAIYRHTPELNSLESSRANSISFSYSQQTDTASGWGFSHGFPAWGVSLLLSNYEAASLGYSLAIIPFVENTLPFQKRVGLYYRLGMGMAYQSAVYDAVENPNNEALSAALNIAIDFRLGVAVQLAEPLSIRTSLNVLHYSNGATKLPNYGLNLGQVNLSLVYHFGKELHFDPRTERPKDLTRENLIAGTAGLRQFQPEGAYYGVQSLLVEHNRKLGAGNILGIGLAVMNSANYIEYEAWAQFWGDGQHAAETFWSTLNFGPYINYEFCMGRLSSYLQTGVYLLGGPQAFQTQIDYGEGPVTHEITLPDSQIFNRVGVRYRLNKHLLIDLGLKTHIFKAQNTEIGIGYRF